MSLYRMLSFIIIIITLLFSSTHGAPIRRTTTTTTTTTDNTMTGREYFGAALFLIGAPFMILTASYCGCALNRKNATRVNSGDSKSKSSNVKVAPSELSFVDPWALYQPRDKLLNYEQSSSSGCVSGQISRSSTIESVPSVPQAWINDITMDMNRLCIEAQWVHNNVTYTEVVSFTPPSDSESD